MVKRQKRNNSLLSGRILAGTIFVVLFIGGVSLAKGMAGTPPPKALTPELQKKKARQRVLAKLLSNHFTYQRENRANPFTPFIKNKKMPTSTARGVSIPEEELTGMQLFEPGQLRLVSIVFSDSRAMAMVQDSAGQGYIINKGTKIGHSGIVDEILSNVVIIKQWSLTFSGQKRYKNIEMVLRKEGE